MKVLYKRSPRTIVLYSDTCSLCFRQLRSSLSSEPVIGVEIADNKDITRENGFRVLVKREVFGSMGIIQINQQVFLAVITGAIKDVANPVTNESVDKIYAVEFVSLSSDEWDFVSFDANGMPVGSEEYDAGIPVHPCHELTKLLCNGSFYYSNDFDLTSLLQNRGIRPLASEEYNASTKRHKKNSLEEYLEEYMWNSFLMEEILKYRSNLDPMTQSKLDKNKFLTIVIRGFAKTVKLSAKDSITIVSKQSWKRAGTRYNARGIDDLGNVANFVETEFIFNQALNNQVFSFTQIRGSVPTFWEQDNTLINPKITLTRSSEATQPVFDMHFRTICEKYGVVHVINLLSKTKSSEIPLLRRYKELYKRCPLRDEIEFTDFDFHLETKQLLGGFAGATKILPLIRQSLQSFGWFDYSSAQGEVINRQDGVFRVNCLDCLDRTNLIEQVISQFIFGNILKTYLAGSSAYRLGYGLEEFTVQHNSLWADHGDAISQIYTGTNALKSSFSRSGKMNFAGALADVTKSVSRIYQNTFVDSKKQSTIDILLGNDAQVSLPVKIYDPINEYVNEHLNKESHLFTSWEDITIYVGTFNVNAATPNERLDITKWLFPPATQNNDLPDIYSIGIQEMIELNAGSILGSDSSKPGIWTHMLDKVLNSQQESYVLLRTESIASMSLFLFVKHSKMEKVKLVLGSSKKTGLGGISANKGACAVRFDFGLTSFALITSHFAAGVNAIMERENDYYNILQGLTFMRNYMLKDHDHVIWFGDLNYRINLPNDYCRYLIENGAFDEMIEYDQLCIEKSKKRIFNDYSEGKIKFYPTYKFDKGTSKYDTSEKQRVPSWTDRILYNSFSGDKLLTQLEYNSVMDISWSDHKPVYSTFKCPVCFIDEDIKAQLTKKLYDTYKKENPDEKGVALLDFSESASSFSRPSSANSADNFSLDTMSELNLIDDSLADIPKLPVRTSNSLRKPPTTIPRNGSSLVETRSFEEPKIISPRKVPPPFAGPLMTSKNLLPNPTPENRAIPPQPPRPRSVNHVVLPKPGIPPLSFSTAPLIESRSHSNSTTPNASSLSISLQDIQPRKKNPIIPAKPLSLASTKVKGEAPAESQKIKKAATVPAPPLPHRNTNQLENKHMSDWKPLMPS